jgi:tetratricopeptide (TPR) repeat protein
MKRALGAWLLIVALAPAARAQENVPGEASRHFQRGVDLYDEGDLRGALVEFEKAYNLLPRAAVLYNIGQTEYQLHDYAASLRTLERFLAETGPAAAHRSEVDATVESLRGRVGWIAVASDRPGCDLLIDDQVAGTTPVAEPILVSIGLRRVTLACASRPRVARQVEVAAGESVRLKLDAGQPSPSLSAFPAPAPRTAAGRRWTAAAWTTTAVLAAGTVGVYAAAFAQSKQLDGLRNTYPISREQLDDKVRTASRLALVGDILAAATIVGAGLSTYLTLSTRQEPGVHVGVALGGLTVRGNF